MLKNKIFKGLVLLLFVLSGLTTNAQLDGLLQKAKDKATGIVEKAANKKEPAGKRTKGSSASGNTATDFTPGDSLLFAEDFSKYKTGTSAASFKTNAVASVVVAEGQKGKWMDLKDKAIYKLSKAIIFPKHFTIEFDVLALGDQITDISPLSFGLATDNSVRDYTSNAGAYVQLHYYDANQVNIGSSNPEKFVNTTFDLAAGLNRSLHVALTIDGVKMMVYLNGVKLAETDLFSSSAAKNFYITGPWEYKNGAQVLLSNLRIYGFSK